MAGDVNLFFNDEDDASNCEIDVMIAEAKFRRQGLARDAVQHMMAYGRELSVNNLWKCVRSTLSNEEMNTAGVTKLGVQRIYAKINERNIASRTLFHS